MRNLAVVILMVLLGACSNLSFVGDAQPVQETAEVPDSFDLPARFAFARVVYGTVQAPGAVEAKLWTDLAQANERLGSFTPLVGGPLARSFHSRKNLITTARAQRFNYLIVLTMRPSNGSADVELFHVGSGAVLATTQATSTQGGKRGFWGGEIRNPARLERTTLRIAQATLPLIQEMLTGIAVRQSTGVPR